MKMNILTTVVVLLTASMVYADFSINQTQNAVDAFNSLNNGLGYIYKTSPGNGQWTMTTAQGYEQADLGAYNPLAGGEFFAKTFCVEPIIGTAPTQYGKLNYENGKTTSSSGNSLTLGSAYLYASFATGTLDGYNYDSPNYYNGDDLTKAIQYLMGATYDTSWGSNNFLSGLLGLNSDKSFWEQTYDPGKYYDIIGDYSVFVMNNVDSNGTNRQDFLYLAGYDEEDTPGAVTPEPASVLIFGAGLFGLGMVQRFRRKRAK